ncbi:MAG TPA: hypothetical protein ENH15_06435 [Actinobacteria bacterium]|nr:hypothetical protein [Actinomycetota bacterium]
MADPDAGTARDRDSGVAAIENNSDPNGFLAVVPFLLGSIAVSRFFDGRCRRIGAENLGTSWLEDISLFPIPHVTCTIRGIGGPETGTILTDWGTPVWPSLAYLPTILIVAWGIYSAARVYFARANTQSSRAR